MKRILIATLALIMLVGAGQALAQTAKGDESMAPGRMHPMGPMGGMGMMDDDDDHPMMMMKHCMMGIDFTDEQRAKIDKLRLDGQKKRLEKEAQMVDLHAKLKLALTADKFNQKELDDIAAKMAKFHQDAVLMRARHMREVRDMLTPEQRIKFDQGVLAGPGGKGMHGPGFKMGRGMGMGMGMGAGCGEGCRDDCDRMMKHHKRGCN